jgi:hypothetical protein
MKLGPTKHSSMQKIEEESSPILSRSLTVSSSSSPLALPKSNHSDVDLPGTPKRNRPKPPNLMSTSVIERIPTPEKFLLPEKSAVKGSPRVRFENEQRDHVVSEIIETEEEYVSDLEVLVDNFLRPLSSPSCLHLCGEKMEISATVETILTFNKKLLSELKRNRSDICRIFLTMSDYFKMYSAYCAAYESFSKKILDLSPLFHNFVSESCKSPRCRNRDFASFLIRPVQRICQYPLLFRELMKHTPSDHPEHDDLLKTKEKLEEVVLSINEAKRLSENYEKIWSIQNSLNTKFELVSPTRRYVREGFLKPLKFYSSDGKTLSSSHLLGHINPPKKRLCYLFNDVILFVKTSTGSSSPRCYLKAFLWLHQVRLFDCPPSGSQHFIELEDIENGENWRLMFDSFEEKQPWVQDIKNTINEFRKKTIMRDKSFSF